MKKVFITGASSGIGKALALAYAKHNWCVGISARRLEILEEVYDVDLKNPPIKNNPLLPDSFVKNNFENKTKLDWESLSQKYNANYVVTPSNWKIKLDLFKNNESFSIYKIK